MASTLLSLRALPLILSLASTVSSLALPGLVSTRVPQAFTRDGCYLDNVNGARAFSAASYAADGMTIESCALFCNKHKFFGLEYGRECWCGDEKLPQTTIAADSDCSFACAGDATSKCGAGYRLDAYTNNAYTGRSPAHLDNIPYLGCFVDAYPRVLPSKPIAGPDMTGAK